MLLKFKAEAKSSRPRPKSSETKARGYEADTKILASRPVCPSGFNIFAENRTYVTYVT